MVTTVEAPTRTEVTVADVLLRAADILSEFDWRQGSSGSRDEGSMCAIGAICEASQDFGGRHSGPAIDVCEASGMAVRFGDLCPLAAWNDTPGRTKAEVIARLREAAGQ